MRSWTPNPVARCTCAQTPKDRATTFLRGVTLNTYGTRRATTRVLIDVGFDANVFKEERSVYGID